MEPWSFSGGYANYMPADEPLERVRSAFGDEPFARLQALKSRLDPDNVLRRNQNIPPLQRLTLAGSRDGVGPGTEKEGFEPSRQGFPHLTP